MKVPEEILKTVTSHCCWHLQCQQQQGWEPCRKVQRLIGDKLLQSSGQTPQKSSCYYHVSFGDADYCTCPVRIEIYKRYKI